MPGLTDLVGYFVPVPLVLRSDPRVSPACALTFGAVVLCLVDKGSIATGGGYLTLRDIAERSWRKPTAVRQHLVDLEAWGYLTRTRRPGRSSRYQVGRLVLEQLELELDGQPAGIGRQGNGPNPAGVDRQTKRRDQPANPAGSYRKNPARADRQTPKNYQDKTGAAQNPNGKRPADPEVLEGDVPIDPATLTGPWAHKPNPWAELEGEP